MFWWLWITKCTSQGRWFWIIILWVVLSGAVDCLFWHWDRHNCFNLQTLITAVTGSCLRGTCHLLHDLLPFLMLLKKTAGWPAGVFGAEGRNCQGFLESSHDHVNTSLISPALPRPPSLVIVISCLGGCSVTIASFWSAHLPVYTPHPFFVFFYTVCHSLANTFYWVPFRLKLHTNF